MINRVQILNFFKNNTEFYRQKLKEITKFAEIPLTTKDELIRSQMEYPPYGSFTDYTKNIVQTYRTSGTTNTPLLLSFTEKDIDFITEVGAECFRHSGMGDVGNHEVVFNCLNLSMWAGGFLDAQAMMKTKVQVINFGTGNTNELIKLIRSYCNLYKVSIHCTPSYLPIIDKKLRNDFQLNPSELNLHSLYLGAEGGVQNNEFRNKLIQQWNCSVFNANYGMSEVCSIMASADNNNILKFSDLLLHHYFIEIIDNKNNIIEQPDLKEGDTGDLVFTSLCKESQPLLRYNTKEKIKIMSTDHHHIYFEIIGRSDDMIVYKGINFFPEQLRHIIILFKELTGIYYIEVKQTAGIIDDINLICELNKNIQINENELRNDLTIRIRHELTLSFNIRFVNNIEIKGNKHKMVEFI